ncbi:hypothetical protein ABZ820_12420 [Streptomyces diacarni]|uniref:hypothetical protein n=1 Tax=Streptomyces diacarni TaxID=2800381 RepID=UPI0033D5F786
MALRGGSIRRIPGNALGGILRDLDRRTRTTTRRTGRPRTGDAPREVAAAGPREGPRGARGPAGPPGTPGNSTQAVTVAVTDEDGRARFEFPVPFPAAPVLTGLPVDPDPAGERTVTCALETVTAEYAVVRVWRTRPRRGQGVADPAGPGVAVHLTATLSAA